MVNKTRTGTAIQNYWDIPLFFNLLFFNGVNRPGYKKSKGSNAFPWGLFFINDIPMA